MNRRRNSDSSSREGSINRFKSIAHVAATVALLSPLLSLPAPAQEIGTRESSIRSSGSTQSKSETKAALIELVGAEKADYLLATAELGRNVVSLDTDPAFELNRGQTTLYGTLRDLRRSLSDGEPRRSPKLNRLIASLDAAELALLGLAEDDDPTSALNDAMSAVYAARREGALSRAQSAGVAESLSDAVFRDRVNRLQFAASRGAPERKTAELQTDINDIKDILTRVDGDEAPPSFPNLKGFGDAFDIDAFRMGVTERIGPVGQISGEVAGYAFSVWKDGKPYYETAGGKARRPSDQPSLAQSPDKPLNVASTTKVLTTVAALKLLEGTSGVGLDTSIENHLPVGWTKGPGLNTVSFRDLLSYCSGFLGMQTAGTDSYDDLKAIIAAGVNSNLCQYENANFGMFRVLIPTMTGNDPSLHFGPIQHLMASLYYASWVRDNVLAPAGVSTGLCEDTTQYPTMYYLMSKPATASGLYKPIDLLLCGGGGWYLSANDWNRFLSHIRFSNYLNQASKKALYGDPLGYTAAVSDSPGVTWAKGGSWTRAGEGAVRTCIFESWNGVTATLLFNSDTKTIGPCSVLLEAFKEAWDFT